MTGREEDVRNILLVSSIANLILNLIFIPRFGLLGAACATALSTILWNILGVIKIKQVYGFLSVPNPFEKTS
jgi:O-antigen/teichoic acid export membrane protein